jgi:hypothetical protein
MDYCVEIRVDKYDYDRHWMWAKNKEIFEWLFKNVGSPNLGFVPPKDVTWDRDLGYQGTDIVLTYRFRRPGDALIFGLKWS